MWERDYQAATERISNHFKYLPVVGAGVNIIRNENHEEEYERKVYIYTEAVVCLAMNNVLKLEQHFVFDENEFIYIYIKE
jgi:hypothetical protein